MSHKYKGPAEPPHAPTVNNNNKIVIQQDTRTRYIRWVDT